MDEKNEVMNDEMSEMVEILDDEVEDEVV